MKNGGGFYLDWDPGTGKTLADIAIAKMLGVQGILVLGPVASLGVWRREVKKWWPQAQVVTLQCTPEEVRQAAKQTVDRPTFWITNYDRLSGKPKKDAKRKVDGRKLARALLKLPYTMLVCDEAHCIKNPKAQRTKRTVDLAEKARFRVLQSGTPTHTVLDWWQQMRLVAPHRKMWMQDFKEYRRWIARFGGPTKNWVVGFGHTETAAVLDEVARYCHTAKSHQLNLPKPILTVTPVELNQEERDAYRQMEKLLFVEVGEREVMKAAIALTKAMRLQQITAGHLENFGIPSTKLQACRELIEERARKKVVVACKFSWEIDQLDGWLDKTGRPYKIIDGSTPDKHREGIQDWFQSTEEPAVILLQYKAGGVALTLTRADALILYSLPSSLIDYRQVIGRVFRIGTTTHVQILPLLATNTEDEDLFLGLRKKLSAQDLATYLTQRARRRAHEGT
jgi:SNF2 family DNA or RNA helicase